MKGFGRRISKWMAFGLILYLLCCSDRSKVHSSVCHIYFIWFANGKNRFAIGFRWIRWVGQSVSIVS